MDIAELSRMALPSDEDFQRVRQSRAGLSFRYSRVSRRFMFALDASLVLSQGSRRRRVNRGGDKDGGESRRRHTDTYESGGVAGL
jgi:hypothetical protein